MWRIIVPGDPAGYKRVPISQPICRLEVAKLVFGRVRLRELPDGLSFRVDLANVTIEIPGDQDIAIVERDRLPGGFVGNRPEDLSTMAIS